MPDKEIQLTSPDTIVQMTKALPDIPNGASPVVYEQVIPNGASNGQSGSPDPVHIGD